MTSIGVITGNLKQHQTGMSTYAYHILDGIRSQYQVTQILDNSGDRAEGCRPIIPKALPLPYNYLTWSFLASFQRRIFSQLDIIHNICQYPIYPIRNKKNIITIYDLIPILYPEYVTPVYAWQSRNILPHVLRKIDHILTISEHTKTDLIRHFHIPPEKIDVTYLGVSDHFRPRNPEHVHQFKEKNNLLDPYILFVGALEPKKNIPGIVKAFSLCLKKMPKLRLVLAGRPSWKFEEIFALIKTLHLEKNIQVLNFVPYHDLPLLYCGAEVFVFPSWYEGFGFPPLEAMKCGTPVIVSDRSSLPEIVGSDGIMVDPNDHTGLSQKIIQVVSNKEYRSQLSVYSQQRASLFTWKKCIKETIETYEKIQSV